MQCPVCGKEMKTGASTFMGAYAALQNQLDRRN